MSFGETLSRFRKNKYRLTQKQVAEGAQLHDSYVSLLERGLRDCPSRATVLNIAQAMRLTPDDRNTLLVSAGYSTDSISALLFEPKLADLDDVMSQITDDANKAAMSNAVDQALILGRTFLTQSG